ncbi:MAG: NAD(P)/FAD-dependent oxidoreductase [Chitinophagales bacterium]
MKRIIVAGGGFAGLKLARMLDNRDFEILLIDKINHHQFQPLFYQVATAALEPSNISFPLRRHFKHSKNIRIRLAEVLKIFPDQNKVKTSIGDFQYDYLIIATGADTNFFGNKNFESLAYPMKSTSQALYLRYHLLQNFEDALSAPPDKIESLLNYVIVGGGPTGVELAGALAEVKKHVLPKDFHDFDFTRMKIMLLEGGDKTLGNMSEMASEYSKKYLEELGVLVMLNTRVKDYDGVQLLIDDGSVIKTKTVIWAAGVKGNLIEGLNPGDVEKGNRIKVNRFNQLLSFPNIYAMGDIAIMRTPKFPNGHPQLANVAINQAKNVAKNFLRQQKNQSLIEYEYMDKGALATVGKHRAVADLPSIKFHGAIAWYAWMGLHLVLLMGFKNRLFVFVNWVIAYFTNNSTLRLIFKPFSKRNL